MGNVFRVTIKSKLAIVLFSLYVLLLTSWAYLHLSHASDDSLTLWSGIYQVIAWYGAGIGFFVCGRWGKFHSRIGRAIIAFSIGLLFQAFGQTAYFIYVQVLHIPTPYPSLGDLGYFGSIPFYAYGAYMLAQLSGVKISLQTFRSQIVAVIIPLAMVGISYKLFLVGYDFDWSQPLKILLDFGYPLGQAIYVSIAILGYLLSRHTLGGIMRFSILAFIFALVAQYVSDFTFLYQASQGTFIAGGVNDQMYSISYTFMAFSLICIGEMYRFIQSSNPTSPVTESLTGTVSIFGQIAQSIIREQALVIGPLAWSEARKVSGLVIGSENDEIAISVEDGKNVLDRLVVQYTRLFGQASQQVCRDAASDMLSKLSANDIPMSLRA